VEVAEDDTHYLSVSRLVPHVVRAVQQLNAASESYADELDDLRERVSVAQDGCLMEGSDV
jgi:hypothetical protein